MKTRKHNDTDTTPTRRWFSIDRTQNGVSLVETVIAVPILGGLALISVDGAEQIKKILAAQTEVASCRGTEAQIGTGPAAKLGLVPTPDPTTHDYRFNTDPHYVINFHGAPNAADISDTDMKNTTVDLLNQVGVVDRTLTDALAEAVVVHKSDGVDILRRETYANLLCIATDGTVVFNGLGREHSNLMGDDYIPPTSMHKG